VNTISAAGIMKNRIFRVIDYQVTITTCQSQVAVLRIMKKMEKNAGWLATEKLF